MKDFPCVFKKNNDLCIRNMLHTKMKYTKAEIENYRNAVIEALLEYGKQYPKIDINTEIEVMKSRSDESIENYMDFNTPQECAWMFIM